MATRKTREELDQQMGPEVPAPEVPEPEVPRPEVPKPEVPKPESPEPEVPEPGKLQPQDPGSQPETPGESPPAEEVSVPAQLPAIVESLLFACGEPVSVQELLKAVQDLQPGLTGRELKKVIEQLRVDLREQGRGIRIAEVAGGYQLRTPSETAPYVKKLVSRRPPRLTRATLETLAIVAYRQPATRADVEEIRGVDSGAVLKHLLDKRLVKILGRKDEPGRPLVYGTTKEFLSFFSLKDLGSLPTLRDFAELSEEHRASLGLEPEQPDQQEVDRQEIEETLKAEFTDAYAPVGEDEVVQELADAISDLRKRDRELKKALPAKPRPETAEESEQAKEAADAGKKDESTSADQTAESGREASADRPADIEGASSGDGSGSDEGQSGPEPDRGS